MVAAERNIEPGNRRLVAFVTVFIALVAFAVSVWAPGPTTEKYDENLWLQRSTTFQRAILHADFAKATAGDASLGLTNPTMPGVTTMWAGVIGRQVARATGALGLSARIEGPSRTSPQVLRAAQSVISLAWALLLWLFMVLVRRLFGAAVSLMTGALIAVEPWAAALAHLLHTDALVTLFSITSLCALAWALHGERSSATTDAVPAPRTAWIVISAALAAGGLLTKTNAIGLLGPGMALITFHAWRTHYRGRIRELARVGGVGLAVVAGVSILAWPALIASPLQQVRLMLGASENVGRVRLRYFHGHLRGFIPQFYVVALAFRLTPWMLVWTMVGALGACADLIRRIRRTPNPLGIPLWVVGTPAIYLGVISLSRFGYDRYALAIVPFGALAGAIVVNRTVLRASRFRTIPPKVLALSGSVAMLAAAVVPAMIAPYGTEYADPLLGGQRAAVRWIPVEGGSSSAELSRDLADQVGGRCATLRVADAYWHPASDRCGTFFAPRTIAELASADYAISFDVNAQGVAREWYRPWLVDNATLVSRVTLGGVPLGELWKIGS